MRKAAYCSPDVVLLVWTGLAMGATIHVPGDCTSIQAADSSPVLQEAIRQWSNLPVAEELQTRLKKVRIEVADLPEAIIAQALGETILLHPTAAGRGWFVDPTPVDHEEFAFAANAGRRFADSTSPAYGRVDLLTVLVHEIGHVLGQGHESGLPIMGKTLASGERVLLGTDVLSLGVNDSVVDALQLNPAGTLIAEATDLSPIAFTIVNSGGDSAIPDVIVSGADSGNGTYLDIGTIIGRAGPGDTIAVALDPATTWNLTGPNAGTVTVEGYSGITFSAIDHLVGAAGPDTFVFPAGVAFGGTLNGGLGANTLDYSARTTGVTVNLATQVATGTTGISNIQGVIGGAGADTITGNSLDNVFTGGPGKDTITGGGGLDTVVETRNANFTLTNTTLEIGSEGEDTLSSIEAARLTGGAGNNTLNASSFTGSVVLDGAAGNDILKGGSGDDVLIGGAGDDDMSGGRGNDEYTGGPGANTLTEALAAGVDTVVETCDGDFTLTNTGLVIGSEGTDTFSGIENARLTGGPGDNNFDLSTFTGGSVWVEGAEGYDALVLGSYGVDASLITDGIVVPGLLSVSYETVEAVTIDDDGVVSADATLNAREYNLGRLVITNDSVLTLASDVSATGFKGVKITTSSDLTVPAGSLISAWS